MKKHRLAAAAAAAILGISAVSSYAAQPLMGGWQAVGSTTVAGDAQAAFDKAVEGLTGAVYEPLDLLATQIVAGTNYCLLCRRTLVVPDAAPSYVLMYIYQDLSGDAKILDIQDLELGVTEETEITEYAPTVEAAKEALRTLWEEEARRDPQYMPEPQVTITNTRIIRIADHPVMAAYDGREIPELQNIACIVEFMMLSNYYSSTYTQNAGLMDSVVLWKNGSVEACSMNPLNMVRSRYYISDFTGIIEEIIDMGDAYSGDLFEP